MTLQVYSSIQKNIKGFLLFFFCFLLIFILLKQSCDFGGKFVPKMDDQVLFVSLTFM